MQTRKKSSPPTSSLAHRRPPLPRPVRSQITPTEWCEWLERAGNLPDVRLDKVAAIRDALANGQYDVDTRLSELIDRLDANWSTSKPSGK